MTEIRTNFACFFVSREDLSQWLIWTARVGMLLAAFVGCRELLGLTYRLGEAAYFQPSFLPEALMKGLPFFVLTASAGAVAICLGRRRAIAARWTDFEQGRELRAFTLLVVGVMVWTYALYDYNLYYARGHYLERALLIAFGIGVSARPVLLAPFLWLLSAIDGQFERPFGDRFGHPVVMLLQGCLVMVFVWQALRWLDKKLGADVLIASILCLLAGQFFYPGLLKLKIGWYFKDEVGLFFAAAQSHGWMNWLSAEAKEWTLAFAAKLNPVIVAGAAVAELGAITVLLSRRLCASLMWIWGGFHIAVFLLSGFLFWQWMLVEAALYFLFLRNRADDRRFAFGIPYAIVGAVLVASSSYWARPARLAWFDTGLDYFYEFHAILEDGTRRELRPEFFAPYQDAFSFSAFSYLSDRPQLLTAYGATGSWQIAKSIYEADTVEQLRALEADLLSSPVDEARKRRFELGVAAMVRNLKDHVPEKRIFSSLDSPPTFWTQSLDIPIADLATARSLEVIRVTTFVLGGRVEEVERVSVMRIPVLNPPEMGDGDSGRVEDGAR